ncbi:M24 family metallopeptidase [Burkholderia sp. MSMB1835]|uniref:M24 family metallopeptidase n=1 Tax=Burkholderia sp. MSMB1835 TaxID=1637876 RepID=UPI000758C884|nr:M24 family metallopeptidase [Burkholderia sp. MSMB1835]KVL37169.1 Xaa-Pro aminopeptidase [Burkholderia sp. MSMB1835]
MTAHHPLPEVHLDELPQFRAVQQLAYRCVETVGAMLYPGITEKEAARLLTEWLQDNGVHDWLHKPFAWFGDRTAFEGFSGLKHMGGFNLAFFPSNRQLETDMPVILDVAPVLDGIVADVGYAHCLGRNPILEQLQDDLMDHRDMIVRLVKARRPMAEVAQEVDALCRRQGVEPRHKAYPFKVLAHRVAKIHKLSKPRFVARFGLNATRNLLLDQGRAAKRQGWSPLWSIDRRSEHAPVPGLWAVEPHLGFAGVGAKFEELLVITDDDAYWLDDDLPHVRRWRRRQAERAHAAANVPAAA